MKMMRCKVDVQIQLPNDKVEVFWPGGEFDFDRVLTSGTDGQKDFTVADAVKGKESEWFEPVVEEAPPKVDKKAKTAGQ